MTPPVEMTAMRPKLPLALRRFAAFSLLLVALASAGDAWQEPGDGAASAPGSAATPPAAMLQLRDGSIRWGRILEHDPDGLVFERLDTGGRVRVAWAFLDPGQERDLRTRFGYVDESSEQVVTEAERIVLVDGQEIVGKIVGREGDALRLKTATGVLEIPKARVRSVASTRVPALDIFTKEELYSARLAETDLEDARALWELARYCERILDFRHALEHYRQAHALDPELFADEVDFILARAAEKAERQEQIDALAEADRLLRRNRFEEALAALAAFAERYPDSPLSPDRVKLEQRVERARTEFLRDLVRRRWFAWMERLLDDAARNRGFEEALTYVDESLSDEIVARTTQDARRYHPTITEDEVRQLFQERKRGRWRPASYGAATWLLGEDKALAGEKPQVEETGPPKSEKQREREQLEERIRRFLQNQEAAKRKRQRDDGEEEDAEAFWKTLSVTARRNWLIAYYAENGGDLEVRPRPELSPCPECGGTGVHEVIFTGSARTEGGKSGTAKLPCPTCHGIGRLRRIRYR